MLAYHLWVKLLHFLVANIVQINFIAWMLFNKKTKMNQSTGRFDFIKLFSRQVKPGSGSEFVISQQF